MLSLELFILIIIMIEINSIGFSTTSKSTRSSLSHSTSTEVVSNAMSSTSTVDLVKMVYFQDFYETMLYPSGIIYSLVMYISSVLDIYSFLHHNNHIVPLGTYYSECHNSLHL
jgi:hypothetical protein